MFTRNTSESLNLVAKSFAPTVLKAGDEVVISIMEHHSNLIPWQQACRKAGATLVYLRPDDQGVITDDEIAAKIGPATKIVAIGEVSNVLGVRNPVEKIAAAAHANGAYVVVDGAQSTPHMAVDVHELGADFFAFSAHKALGPMGIGVLWGKHELLDQMPPMLTGGEMIDSVTEQDAAGPLFPRSSKPAHKTPQASMRLAWRLITLQIPLAMRPCKIASRRLSPISCSSSPNSIMLASLARMIPRFTTASVSFNVQGIHPHHVASIMDMSGVCIRAGHHCAQPLLTWLGVGVSCLLPCKRRILQRRCGYRRFYRRRQASLVHL